MSTATQSRPTKRPLGEVAKFLRGITFKPDDVVDPGTDDSVVCMRTKNVQADLDQSDLIAVPRQFVKRDELYLRESDILVSTANSWNLVGKCSWVPRLDYDATAGGFISILRADATTLFPRYLYHWFNSDAVQHAVRQCGRQTTNISNMSFEQCEALEIPLPTLPEQKRIADILDKADAIRRKRREAIAAASSLLVVSFLELFGDAISNPRSWPTSPIGDLASLVTSGLTPRGGSNVYANNGPYFIRSQNVLMNGLDLTDAACLPLDTHEAMSRTKVAVGDVLLNITGASIGRVTWVESLDREANVNQHVCIIRPTSTMVAAPYLSVALSLPASQEWINRIQSGASRQGLNHQQVRSIVLPVPPRPLQARFEKIVCQLRRSQKSIESSREESEALFNSLVQRAFRGEL